MALRLMGKMPMLLKTPYGVTTNDRVASSRPKASFVVCP